MSEEVFVPKFKEGQLVLHPRLGKGIVEVAAPHAFPNADKRAALYRVLFDPHALAQYGMSVNPCLVFEKSLVAV